MAIKVTPKVSAKMTETGPAPVEPGVAEPTLDTPIDFDAAIAAAKAWKEKNTVQDEEAPAEEPKLPKGKTEIEFLGEQAEKAKGSAKAKVAKMLEFKASPSADMHGKLADSIAAFGKKWGKIRKSLSGLVVKDANEQDVDAAGEFNKHVENLIYQAGRHVEAAGQKEARGITGDSSISEQLATMSGTRVAKENFPTRSGASRQFDDLDRFAPIRDENILEAMRRANAKDATDEEKRNRPPTEEESLDFLGKYANNSYIKAAQNFSSMTSSDHARHARNIIAGLTAAIPRILGQIHQTPDLVAQMKLSGKVGMLPEDARKLLNPSLINVSDKTDDYVAEASKGEPNEKPAPTIYDAFGLDHHLKRLINLSKSSSLQQKIGSQLDLVSKVYNQRYSSLLQKYAAGRGHVVSAPLEPVRTTTAPTADPNAEFDMENAHHRAEVAFKSAGEGAKELHDFRMKLASIAPLLTPEQRFNAPDLLGLDKTNIKYEFNEDGTYKGSNIDAIKLGSRQGVLADRAASLKAAGASHPLNQRWAPLIDKASKLTSSLGEVDRAHKLLDTVQNSMEKNGVSVRENQEVREKNPSTIPTLDEFAAQARVGQPIIETPLKESGGIADPRVDLTWGGTEDPSLGRLSTSDPYLPEWFQGKRQAFVVNPSVKGFHIPSENWKQESINQSQRDAVAAKKEAGRRAELDAAAAAAKKASALGRSVTSYDPWLVGPGNAALDFSDLRVEKDEETQAPAPKRITSLPSKVISPMATVYETTTEVPGTEPGTTAAERADALFSDRRKR